MDKNLLKTSLQNTMDLIWNTLAEKHPGLISQYEVAKGLLETMEHEEKNNDGTITLHILSPHYYGDVVFSKQVVAFCRDNKKINAIKQHRVDNSDAELGLFDAKNQVEALYRHLGLG